ncbi:hypothetical protein SAMN04487996_10425 [Dyadobacter soli]|uniref:DUF5675 domain-containing protein n=1 Tax=Dyadobacter soli TaxID=659014 RepID=A0A1G7B052_9BACT|nr:DUF5675 family protein [Dyadobacter soli]SDE20227.1 hypothetical protein SAMN04487996_10425 [Dyadobacter soli]
MDITVAKIKGGQNSTISSLSVNGRFFCYVLQDADRGLVSTMTLEEIKAKKVHGATAIPEGKYQVVDVMSPRFKRRLPRLVDVPGFAGILIHPGNTHLDTEGCLLPGTNYRAQGKDWIVTDSRKAFDGLYQMIQERIQAGEKIWCKIVSAY